MKRCRICNKPIEHLHANRKICYECERKQAKKHNYTEPTVTMSISEFKKLQHYAEIGRKCYDQPTYLSK